MITKLFFINSISLLNKAYTWLQWNLTSPSKPHTFTSAPLLCMPVPGVKCPNCGDKGKTVWVIPGKNCPQCGTPCGRIRVIETGLTGMYILTCATISTLIVGIYLTCVSYDFISGGDTSILMCDAPRPWGLYFQDTASPQMEALVELHNNIMFYLIIILFTVGWILGAIIVKYVKPVISNKYVNHGTLVELVWTITPGLILILIAFTSFRLLYLNDEVSDINVTVYAEGHQWYWSYLFPDFLGENGDNIEFDSYLTPESDLGKGQLRMLDVDQGISLPEVTHTKLIISSGDVIHSYACPSLGLKTDAYPGRLNQASTLLNRLSTYFGQCSEICGILHSSMPIKISSVPLEKFLIYISDK